ncbi:MAG: hypothetical protein ACR2JC_18440 [Chloroflexota bacterium]
MGLLDKLMGRAQDTLNDPQKMDSIKGKLAGALNKRIARGSQGGYYNTGFNQGMGGYVGGDDYGRGSVRDQDSGDWNHGVSSDPGGSDPSGSSASGSWDSGGSSDSGGWDSGGGEDGGEDSGGSGDGD